MDRSCDLRKDLFGLRHASVARLTQCSKRASDFALEQRRGAEGVWIIEKLRKIEQSAQNFEPELASSVARPGAGGRGNPSRLRASPGSFGSSSSSRNHLPAEGGDGVHLAVPQPKACGKASDRAGLRERSQGRIVLARDEPLVPGSPRLHRASFAENRSFKSSSRSTRDGCAALGAVNAPATGECKLVRIRPLRKLASERSSPLVATSRAA